MQADRSAEPARLAGTVRGLGVCDVLRVELAACQHAVLDQELQRRAAALRSELGEVEKRGRGRAVGSRRRAGDAAELERLREDVRVLARVRASVPRLAQEPFLLVAPAGLVAEVVGTCLRTVVAAVAAGLGEGPAHPWAATGALEAASAWITTALDCQAVEAFCLEPGVDPLHTR
jgi:hypothetical protein